MRVLHVGKGHAKALWSGHPWVHAAAVRRIDDPSPEPPPHAHAPLVPLDVVEVRDADGRRIGRGFLSEGSAIRVRLFEQHAPDADADDLLDARVHHACDLRRRLFPTPEDTNAYRLVHSEGDGLPGLVVDRYGDVLVAQFATGAMHRRRERLAATLLEASGATSLVARAGGYEREEGIAVDDVAFVAGAALPEALWVREAGLDVEVEPRGGQKTGHYVDQRENRVLVGQVASGLTVLDLYAGTGLFSVQALCAGATSALAVDASAVGIERARRHAAKNGVAQGFEGQATDVREALAELKGARRRFGLVVVDPPNFFPRRGGEGRAQRAYRDLNVQALTRVAEGGLLATFSCSARLDADGLRAVVASAALECRRPVRILRELTAGPDHPFLAAAPEGRYLTGLLVSLLAQPARG